MKDKRNQHEIKPRRKKKWTTNTQANKRERFGGLSVRNVPTIFQTTGEGKAWTIVQGETPFAV